MMILDFLLRRDTLKQVNLRIPLTVLSIGIMAILVEAIPNDFLEVINPWVTYLLPIIIVSILFFTFEKLKLNSLKVNFLLGFFIVVLGISLEPLVSLI